MRDSVVQEQTRLFNAHFKPLSAKLIEIELNRFYLFNIFTIMLCITLCSHVLVMSFWTRDFKGNDLHRRTTNQPHCIRNTNAHDCIQKRNKHTSYNIRVCRSSSRLVQRMWWREELLSTWRYNLKNEVNECCTRTRECMTECIMKINFLWL